jgi:hypothetical protein
MSKATRKNIISSSRTKDQKIIDACISYGLVSGAIQGACKADPNPDNKHAEPVTNACYTERHRALKAASAKAETLESIRAKARVLSIMIDENRDTGTLEETETTFAASFARDVETIFSDWLNLGYQRTATALKAVQS